MADKLLEEIAVIVTALATATTALLMWRANRREVRRERPIVECHINTHGNGLLYARFMVRNRMDETLVVTAARVRNPRGAKIGTEVNTTKDGGWVPAVPTATEIRMEREVDPLGHFRRSSLPAGLSIGDSHYRSDQQRVDVYVLPPEGWLGGMLRIDLRISNRTVETRDKWIAVKRRISADTMTKIGARAESTDQK